VLAADLAKLVSVMAPGDCRIATSKDGKRLELKTGKSTTRLPFRDVDDFSPVPQALPSDVTMTIGSQDLAHAIRQTAYARSLGTTRAHLACLHFDVVGEKLSLVATDGHRLALSETTVASGASFSLGNKAVKNVAKAAAENSDNVTVSIGKHYARFTWPDLTIVARLVDDPFPPYRKLIPQVQPVKLTVERETLIASIRRVTATAAYHVSGVKLVVSEGRLSLYCESDRGESTDEIDVEYAGDSTTVHANHKYLSEALNAMASNVVTVELADEKAPIVIKNHDDSCTAVVMPMRG
jgi:DNA polymerase-3 subunit beta